MDLTQISDLALGDLWTAAHSIKLWDDDRLVDSVAANTARELLALGRTRTPTFRGAACRDYMELLASKLGADPVSSAQNAALWSSACFALSHCTDLSFVGLAPAAQRFLAASDRWPFPHAALVLARLAGPAFAEQVLEKLAGDWVNSPLLVAELRVAGALDLPKHLALATVTCGPPIGAAPDDRQPPLLADEPSYADFAATGLQTAATRLRSIHDGAVAYAADAAFTLAESAVVARLARVGLSRDEPWMPALLDDIFRLVGVAPTAAKTLPSQSVSIALGYAVEAWPTPEAVSILRDVVRAMRHAGVKKKLERNLRSAERRLPHRPEIAARLTSGQAKTDAARDALIRSLEASFGSGLEMRDHLWRGLAADHGSERSRVTQLIWRVGDPNGATLSVLPAVQNDQLILTDVNGSSVAQDLKRPMSLWHPADASAEERTAWRDRISALRIKQPFRQVFREHYEIPPAERSGYETGAFADYVVSGTPLAGLARREGWRFGDGSIERQFGPWLARFALTTTLYPGIPGSTRTRTLSFWTFGGGAPHPVRLGDLPPVIASEALRAVDLLVSTSAFGIEATYDDPHRERHLHRLSQQPLGAAADMRKEAVRCALRGLDGMADVEFGARHLHLGPYAIHLATGRVTRGGELVTIQRPARSNLHAVPWLPYDEKLLEVIVHAAVDVAAMRRAETPSAQENSP